MYFLTIIKRKYIYEHRKIFIYETANRRIIYQNFKTIAS